MALKKVLKDFDIAQIANSGQCFRISNLDDDLWEVLAFNQRLIIKKLTQEDYIFECTEKEFQDYWIEYFDFKTNYSQIKQKIYQIGDSYLNDAINYGYGIRILKQDLWETIVSFIISQQNNIPRIRGIIKKLCDPFDGRFPSPFELSGYSESNFIGLGLGYRARYIFDIVRAFLDEKLNLEKLKGLETSEAKVYLKRFNGIGEKVANCILLYGLHRIEAFPIDVWIKRIIDLRYNGNFDITKFENFAGIIQQYMFFYERSKKF